MHENNVVRGQPREFSPEAAEWRSRILRTTVRGTAAIGAIAYVVSVWIALQQGEYRAVVLDTIIYGGILGIALSPKLPYKVQAYGLLGLLLTLSLGLIIMFGPHSPGFLWLFAYPVASAMLLGMQGARVSLGVLMASLGAISAGVLTGQFSWSAHVFSEGPFWILYVVNFIAVSAIVSLGIAVLLRSLNESLAHAKDVGVELEEERMLMHETSERLIRAIMERAKVERERAQLASAVEQAREMILISDVQGHLQYVNAAFGKRTGHRRHEVAGKLLTDLGVFGPETSTLEDALSALKRGEDWTGNHAAVRRDGSTFKVEASFTPLRDDNGRIAYFVGVMRDVTREDMLEEQLRQSQKLEAIGTFAGGIAHDFNNMLLPIVANAEIVKESFAPGTEQYGLLDDILHTAARARGVVRQILTFSRKRDVHREPVSLDQTLEEAVRMLRSMLPRRISIQLDLASQMRIVADATEIHQIVMNLGTNAQHAMSEAGVLRIESAVVPRADVDPRAAPQNRDAGYFAHIQVSDTGRGMSAATIARAFDPFFTTKEPGEGTGLGLATVHGIATSLGGGITIDSETGSGTVVHLYLPVFDADATSVREHATKAEAPIARQQSDVRVLLVDDERDVLNAERRALSHVGFQVFAVEGGLAALDAIRGDEKFDVLLTDLRMPKMSGIELADAARRERPGLPVIVATGFIDTEDEKNLESSGISHVISKPFALEELRRVVLEAVED